MKTKTTTRIRFPQEIRCGAAVATIYRVTNASGYEYFQVADRATGKRRVRSFGDYEAARAEAEHVVTKVADGETLAAGFSKAEVASFVRARELLSESGVELETACALFAEAVRVLGNSGRLVEAARDYARRYPLTAPRKSLTEAADEYLAFKAARGRSSRYLQDIRARLARFVQEHPGKVVGDILTANLQHWLDALRRDDGQPVGVVTRRNFATVLSGFFELARKRGYTPDNPCADLEREKVRKSGDVEFYTPDEARRLLTAAEPELVPALALTLFAGLRSAEVCRLVWRDVDFNQGHVAVAGDKSKTASRRLVPLADNLREWLLPHQSAPDAPIWSQSAFNFSKAVTATAERAHELAQGEGREVRRLDNGARHSWISYRVAQTGDVARAALEGGNSPTVVHGHYRGLATPEQAAEWFAVRPR